MCVVVVVACRGRGASIAPLKWVRGLAVCVVFGGGGVSAHSKRDGVHILHAVANSKGG